MSTKKTRRFSLPEEKLESLKEHAEQKASEVTLGGDVVTDIPLSKLSPARGMHGGTSMRLRSRV